MRAIAFVIMMLLVASISNEKLFAADGLFGSNEVRSQNMQAFTKWSDMWRRHNLPRRDDNVNNDSLQDSPPVHCLGKNRIVCQRREWEALIAALDGEAVETILARVNSHMNRSPYIIDPLNWGIPDYWATPREFFLKDGDCEDYAISKYVTLKRLGIDPDAMRLVVLQDENLNAAHAVLAVDVGNETFILDNQTDGVLPHTKILHYRPVYSINESAWWLHQRPLG